MKLTPCQVTPSETADEAARLAGDLQRWVFQIQNNLMEISPGDDLTKLHQIMKDHIEGMGSKGFHVCSCAPLGGYEVNRSMVECMAQAPSKPGPAEAFLIDLDLRSFQYGADEAVRFLIKAIETGNDGKVNRPAGNRLVMIDARETDIQSDLDRIAAVPLTWRIPVLMTIEDGPASVRFPDEPSPLPVASVSPCAAALILLAIGESVAKSIHLTRQQNPDAADECMNALRSAFASDSL